MSDIIIRELTNLPLNGSDEGEHLCVNMWALAYKCAELESLLIGEMIFRYVRLTKLSLLSEQCRTAHGDARTTEFR
jgi:hypothetical protein